MYFPWIHERPNENKISHRWREGAQSAMEVLRSCENYAPERPAVGWIEWLGGVGSLFLSFSQPVNGVSHRPAGREEETILKMVGFPSALARILEFVDISPGAEDIRRAIEQRSKTQRLAPIVIPFRQVCRLWSHGYGY